MWVGRLFGGSEESDVPSLGPRARLVLVAACLVTVLPTVAFDSGISAAALATASGLVVVQAAALWAMSAAPGTATAVVIAVGAVIGLIVPALGFGIAVVALCTLAWLRPPRASLPALAAVLALVVLDGVLARPWSEALLWAAGAVLAWTWGELGRVRSARRRVETRRAVLEDRARIARELHDVIAHTVSVMVVQAAAADDVFDVRPQQARAAVRAVEAAGRQAQAELAQLLHAVRGDEPTGPAPQPGFADLGGLADSVTRAGLRVRMELDGVEEAVPAGVQLSAYRIVQESLTNVLRHARAGRADVAVRVVDGAVLVEVVDDGSGPVRRGGAGRGLAGMRERAEQLGGTLHAGPDPGGGFRVAARLPLRGRP